MTQGKSAKKMQDSSGDTKDWFAGFRSRLRDLRGVLGFSQSDLAHQVGVKLSAVSWIETGRSKQFGIQTLAGLARLCDDYGFSLRWLLLGAGQIRRDDADAVAVLDDLRIELAEILRRIGGDPPMGTGPSLSPAIQEVVDILVKSPSEMAAMTASRLRGTTSVEGRRPAPHHVQEFVEPGFIVVEPEQLPAKWSGRYVPIIGRLAAGEGLDTDEAESYPPGVAYRYLAYDGAPGHSFAVEISGSSMTPDYRHGDMAIIDPDVRVSAGVCAILVKRDGQREPKIKRLRISGKTAILESLNPAVKPIRVPAANVEAFGIWKHLPLMARRRAD